MAWIDYTFRAITSVHLERGRDNDLDAGAYRSGVLVAPSSGTVSVYDANNTAVVAGAAVVVTGSKATYTVTGATTSGLTLGGGWRVEWSLVMPDLHTHVFRQSAALCRVRLAPVVTDADLLRYHPDLGSYLGGAASWQSQIDAAWAEIVNRLEANGKRPYLVTGPSALYETHLYASLAIVCRLQASTGDEGNIWNQLAERYEARREAAWNGLSFEYDETDSGQASGSRRTAAQSSYMLCSRGGSTWLP